LGSGSGDKEASGTFERHRGASGPRAPARRAAAARIGKRVGGYTYVHREALPLLPEEERALVEKTAGALHDHDWNVAKVGTSGVSLLLYEDFEANAFPALLRSVRPDPGGGPPRVTDYAIRENPPILHRKERLLPPDDPRIPTFASLTEAAEAHGLFRESRTIGTRVAWERRIAEAGLELRGHTLVPRAPEPSASQVARHKTAIARRELSQPVSLMLRFGLVSRGNTVMDYGCGLGDDAAALSAAGFDVAAWDPWYRPDGPLRPSSAVNLGFVVNVIEEPDERRAVVEAAWALAQRVLVVSVMPYGKADVSGLRPYGDGFLTSWGTFQRYYRQDELRAFVKEATGEAPVSLAPGIVAAFRDKELEQEVAYRRRSRATRLAEDIAARPRPPRADRPARPSREPLADRLAEELDGLWQRTLELGRVPAAADLAPAILDALAGKRISLPRALSLARSRDEWDAAEIEQAGMARREDLLVHFALTLFPGAPRYASLPATIQRDVRAFFGSHGAMMEEAEAFLFATGRRERQEEAIGQAVADGLGGRLGEAFAFRLSELSRLPATLRILVGCAEILLHDAVSGDFATLRLEGPLLSVFRTASPEKVFPEIVEEVHIDLKTRRVRRKPASGRVLYLKSRYMPRDDAARSRQADYDARLRHARLVEADGSGPRIEALAQILRNLAASSDRMRDEPSG